ncbi:hypothetical protein B0H13DRAFT_1862275 [Mycena leptocephala]|nr:hypothetical protein B0H13DRAFT_1862275 [Mycena leptocephala]
MEAEGGFASANVQRRRSADLPTLQGSRSTASLILSRIDYAAPRVLQVQRRRCSLWEFSPLAWAAHPDSLWCHFQFVRTIFVLRPIVFATVNEGMWEPGFLFVAHTEKIPPPRTEQVVRARWASGESGCKVSFPSLHTFLLPGPLTVPVLASLSILRQSTLDRAVRLLVLSIRATPNFFKSRIHYTGGINLSFMPISIRIDLLNKINPHCAADGPVRERNILSTEIPLGYRMQVAGAEWKSLSIIHAAICIFVLLGPVYIGWQTQPLVPLLPTTIIPFCVQVLSLAFDAIRPQFTAAAAMDLPRLIGSINYKLRPLISDSALLHWHSISLRTSSPGNQSSTPVHTLNRSLAVRYRWRFAPESPTRTPPRNIDLTVLWFRTRASLLASTADLGPTAEALNRKNWLSTLSTRYHQATRVATARRSKALGNEKDHNVFSFKAPDNCVATNAGVKIHLAIVSLRNSLQRGEQSCAVSGQGAVKIAVVFIMRIEALFPLSRNVAILGDDMAGECLLQLARIAGCLENWRPGIELSPNLRLGVTSSSI